MVGTAVSGLTTTDTVQDSGDVVGGGVGVGVGVGAVGVGVPPPLHATSPIANSMAIDTRRSPRI